MNTQKIAQALYQHCENHTEAQALEELYAENAVSVEPMAMGDTSPISEGIGAIKAKHEWWAQNFEVHDARMEGPFINGNQFAIVFEIDATDKNSGQRWKSKEVALYEVEEDKIHRESFFMLPME